MTDPLPESRLREIEERCGAATAGPWTTEKPKQNCGDWPSGVVIAAVARGQCVYADPPGGSYPEADRQYIAHARTDLPTLAAEVRRLRGALEEAVAREREAFNAAYLAAHNDWSDWDTLDEIGPILDHADRAWSEYQSQRAAGAGEGEGQPPSTVGEGGEGPECSLCGLPANVHGHGETGRYDSHPFQP